MNQMPGRKPLHFHLAALGAVVSLLPPANLAGAAESFRYRGPEGVTFIVTPAGLSSILVKEQEVAKGDWMATDAGYLLTAGAAPNPLTFTNRSLEPSGPDRVRVRHTGKDAAVTFDYWFSGEDARIKARVENNRPDRPIRAIS